MDVLTFLAEKYGVILSQRKLPIEIPDTDRDTLAHLFGVFGFTRGVELGVERGHYAEVLLRENVALHLSCVDAWRAYPGYRDHVSQEKLDRFYVETSDRLRPYQQRTTLIRQFSVDAAPQFADGSLDFVYIDAAHDVASVIADLSAWARKVRVGGIVAGHDYIRVKPPSLMHVPQAIHAWTDAYQIAPWFVLGRHEKVAGEKRDDGRSWFYVQPEPVPRKGRIQQ